MEMFKLVNDRDDGIYRIQRNGLGFLSFSNKEPADGWRNRLPSRANGFRIGYF